MLAGHRGHYITRDMIRMAIYCGWQDPEAPSAVEGYEDHWGDIQWEHFDSWFDIADEALAYLNSITVGGGFDWEDGELFLRETPVEPRDEFTEEVWTGLTLLPTPF